MLQRNLVNNRPLESLVWEDLTNGVPTISALASLSSEVLGDRQSDPSLNDLNGLSLEARAILKLASKTGSISIRGDKNAFEPEERYLAICVEMPESRRLEFRISGDPQRTIRFLEGFRQLCCHGLVMHQLMNEFSLTAVGFEVANTVNHTDVEKHVAMAREF